MIKDKKINIAVDKNLPGNLFRRLSNSLLPCCYSVKQVDSAVHGDNAESFDLKIVSAYAVSKGVSHLEIGKTIIITDNNSESVVNFRNGYIVHNVSEDNSFNIIKSVAEGMWAEQRLLDVESRITELATTMGSANSVGKFFLATLHDLKNSLAVISGHAQTMETSPIVESGEDPDLIFSLKTIEKHVTTLLNSLGVLSAVGKKRSPALSRTTISGIVENIKLIFSSSARKTETEIVFFIREDAPEYIQTDQEYLLMATGEVLFNSFENIPDGGGGKININIYPAPGDILIIEINDDCGGMSEEAASRLFENFYTTKEGTPGLGLPFARTLLSKIGASIEACGHKEQGTTVKISIPFGA